MHFNLIKIDKIIKILTNKRIKKKMYITYYFSVSEMMFTCLSQNDGFLNASHFLWPSYFFV